jgi:hypothetical protein
MDIGRVRLGTFVATGEDIKSLEYIETQAVLAARQSARVASLLQVNQMLRSHCWVAV